MRAACIRQRLQSNASVSHSVRWALPGSARNRELVSRIGVVRQMRRPRRYVEAASFPLGISGGGGRGKVELLAAFRTGTARRIVLVRLDVVVQTDLVLI
jgi:hypothetical protein